MAIASLMLLLVVVVPRGHHPTLANEAVISEQQGRTTVNVVHSFSNECFSYPVKEVPEVVSDVTTGYHSVFFWYHVNGHKYDQEYVWVQSAREIRHEKDGKPVRVIVEGKDETAGGDE